MYCSKCGQEIRDEAIICPHCGCATGNKIIQNTNVTDYSSVGLGFLGFIFPLIGLIFYLVWKDQYPLKAKSIGWGALINVLIPLGLVVVGLFVNLLTL